MRDRTRPVPGKDAADPCGGRHAHRRAWPAPPPPQPRHGIGPDAGGQARRRTGVNGPRWPARYEIRVDSVLDDRWADWFGGLQASSDSTQTVIVGLLPDQPALHGVLTKIRDLGLCLISVRRLDPGEAGKEPPQ